jgi:purine-binding chemotaxis protein CheW
MNTPTLFGSELTQYLTFAVATEEYAIEILRVREILVYSPLTRVPRAPEFIAGVMNLRGSVVPVVDLRIKLGLPPTVITGTTCVVIVDIGGENGRTESGSRGATVGLLADDVRQVMDLAAGEIEPPPAFGTKIDLAFLRGMGDLGDRFALILDIDRLLTALELIAATAAADAQAAAAASVAAPTERAPKKARRPDAADGAGRL